jgi:hypothetical protein
VHHCHGRIAWSGLEAAWAAVVAGAATASVVALARMEAAQCALLGGAGAAAGLVKAVRALKQVGHRAK